MFFVLCMKYEDHSPAIAVNTRRLTMHGAVEPLLQGSKMHTSTVYHVLFGLVVEGLANIMPCL